MLGRALLMGIVRPCDKQKVTTWSRYLIKTGIYKNTQNASIYMNESKEYSLVSMCGQTLTENATDLSNNNKD